ncbi:hypothetical protein [Bradyrhizobium sp. sGM-13]|uniref:hypothetical protein n=1 Tax=Bradyrhizobium sp. sGM-13 TaxID=2831781 RepID=UPI001BD0F5B3|nr:hypothetical protein [Bradyrhizobium sp. sGM-13]
MRRTLLGLAGLATVLVAMASASAQQPIKIGLITPYFGQFADTASPAGRPLDSSMLSDMAQGAGSVSSTPHFLISSQARKLPARRRASSPWVASCIVNCIRRAGGTDPVVILNSCMGLCERTGGIVVF